MKLTKSDYIILLHACKYITTPNMSMRQANKSTGKLQNYKLAYFNGWADNGMVWITTLKGQWVAFRYSKKHDIELLLKSVVYKNVFGSKTVKVLKK